MKKITLLLAVLLLCLTSCTTKTNLCYTPVIEQQEKNQINLKVEAFEDLRSEGQQIGANRNLYWMPIIKIVTDDSIPEWVNNAFKTELTNAGYSIVDTLEENHYLLEGKIIKLFADTHLLYHARMGVKISLKKGNEILFEKIYRTNKGGGISKTLEYNLQEICKLSVDDINQHLLKTSAEPVTLELPSN
jgi:hypothetical protein